MTKFNQTKGGIMIEHTDHCYNFSCHCGAVADKADELYKENRKLRRVLKRVMMLSCGHCCYTSDFYDIATEALGSENGT